MKNLLFVVAHKQFKVPEPVRNAPYKIVLVGSGAKENDESYWNEEGVTVWRDNEGINISDKNSHYCELSAHYYVWKNKADEYDNIGLCHYRRYFTENGFSIEPKHFFDNKKIDKLLSRHDIVLPKKIYRCYKLKLDDDGLVRRILERQGDPDIVAELNRLENSNSASFFNMFIMKKKHFNEYSEWLFDFFAEYEKERPLTDDNKRICGYISEYLLYIWVKAKKLRIKYEPVAFPDFGEKYQQDWAFRSIFHLNGYNIREKFGLKPKNKKK